MYYLMVEKANGSLLLYFHSPVACENTPTHSCNIFFVYWFTGNDPANEETPNST